MSLENGHGRNCYIIIVIYIYIYIYTPHPILPTPPFLNPLSHHLPPWTSTALSVVLFLWQNGCNEIMDLHMSSLGTLVPGGPWCLFYATLSSLLKADTKYGCLLVPWLSITHTHIHTHTQTHTHTHTNTHHTKTHSRASRLTHLYKYIFTPPVMCSQQLSLLHWMNNSLI